MSMLKEINDSVNELINEINEIFVEGQKIVDQAFADTSTIDLLEAVANDLRASDDSVQRSNVKVKKGDIVIDVSSDKVKIGVATGKEDKDGNYIVAFRDQEKALDPHFFIVGARSSNAKIKAAAQRLSSKYPTRRVLAYGVLPRKRL